MRLGAFSNAPHCAVTNKIVPNSFWLINPLVACGKFLEASRVTNAFSNVYDLGSHCLVSMGVSVLFWKSLVT